jgi:hypothetical protein
MSCQDHRENACCNRAVYTRQILSPAPDVAPQHVPTRRPAAGFCGAKLSSQEAEITGNARDPSGLANTDGSASAPSDLVNTGAMKPAIHH